MQTVYRLEHSTVTSPYSSNGVNHGVYCSAGGVYCSVLRYKLLNAHNGSSHPSMIEDGICLGDKWFCCFTDLESLKWWFDCFLAELLDAGCQVVSYVVGEVVIGNSGKQAAFDEGTIFGEKTVIPQDSFL
jgi:hypothetical protein